MKNMKQLVIGFIFGVVVTTGATFLIYRHNKIVLYDGTVSAHLTESIVMADLIRSDRSDKVLELIDNWLLGDSIHRSYNAFITSDEVLTEMLERLDAYREKRKGRSES